MLESKLITRFGHLHPRVIPVLEALYPLDQSSPPRANTSHEDAIKGFYRLHLLDKLNAMLISLPNMGILASTHNYDQQLTVLECLKNEESTVNFLEDIVTVLQNDNVVVTTKMVLEKESWQVAINLYKPGVVHITFLNKLGL